MTETEEQLKAREEEYTKQVQSILNGKTEEDLGLDDLNKIMQTIDAYTAELEKAGAFTDERKEERKTAVDKIETLRNRRLVAADERATQIEGLNVQIQEYTAAINDIKSRLSSIENTSIRFQFEQLLSNLEEALHGFERDSEKLKDEINTLLNGGEIELPEINETYTETQIENMLNHINKATEYKKVETEGLAQGMNFEEMLGLDPEEVKRTSEQTVQGMSEQEILDSINKINGVEQTQADTSSTGEESSGEADASEDKDEIERLDFGAPAPKAAEEGSTDSESGEDEEENKEEEKEEEKEVEKDHTVASATSTTSSSDEEVDIEDKGLTFEENNPKQNVQNMIDYINKMTKDTRVKKVNNKRENMSLAQAVERGLLPKNLGEDRILEIANEMGIKADNMDRVVTPNVLDALMDDKEVKIARANLEIANKRQEQVNKNAKALETIGAMDMGKDNSEKLSEGIQNLAEGLTEKTIEINESNQQLKADSVTEHFDLNGHYSRGDRAYILDNRGTKLNDKIREKYVELAKRTEQRDNAKGKIRQAFANYRVEKVAAKIQRLKKKEGRVTAKEIALMNKETDKYIAKKQKDLDRYMHRQEKLQERVDKYKDLSARRQAADKAIKQNNAGLKELEETKDRDLLSVIERGVTHISNGINKVKMGALKARMGSTELGHLASQTFDLRLSNARDGLSERVGRIRNSEKYRSGGMETDLGVLQAMEFAREMSMAA